jgi:hypothetical protein
MCVIRGANIDPIPSQKVPKFYPEIQISNIFDFHFVHYPRRFAVRVRAGSAHRAKGHGRFIFGHDLQHLGSEGTTTGGGGCG